ncbi:MAG: hypothetical protein ACXWOL_15670 [Ktedonobacteraceae bacterium]
MPHIHIFLQELDRLYHAGDLDQPEFIAFTSTKGQALLAQMHEKAMQQARKNLDDLEKRLHSSFEKFLKRLKQEEVTR